MKRPPHLFFSAILIAVAGTIFFFSPFGQKFEEDLGLTMLFALRGPQMPPDDVAIVNLDDESSRQLGLPANFSRWPRSIHAQMVEKLHEYGAKVIVFDVYFAEARDTADDKIFAKAIGRAGNVVLFEELRRESPAAQESGKQAATLAMDTLIPPQPLFAEAALALAPFPMPKIPVRITQGWIFKDSAGEAPTLPAVAAQALRMQHYDRLHALLHEKIPDLTDRLPASSDQALSKPGLLLCLRGLRELFIQDRGLADGLITRIKTGAIPDLKSNDERWLLALISMYAGGNSAYVNFYGPPATIRTLSYHEILAPAENTRKSIEELIKGKVVFIGAARTSWPGQKDGFYTVFSREDGLDLSGVEIAATLCANLLENKLVRPLSGGGSLALLLAWGVGASLLCFLLPAAFSLPVMAASIAASLYCANFLFTAHGIWPPLIIPFGLQSLAAFSAAMLSRYLMACRERKNIRAAMGFYLPDKVVRELTHDLSFITTGDRLVYGACLLTDAQRYTSLSEQMPPSELSILMKDYYRALFKPVSDLHGQVCNVIGDSMLALWPSAQPEILPREQACQAALQILAAVDQFNREHPDSPLPTRIGLHYGYLLIGNIGAENHFEYAPIGDIVNTASRIEGLNKMLATRILASEETVAGLNDVSTRKLGKFLFAGKTQAITVYELTPPKEQREREQSDCAQLFAESLSDFENRRWETAMQGFCQCINMLGDDGPSRYYLQLCEKFLHHPPPAEWAGVVQVEK
jgi:adenylate cyclase